MGGAAVLALAGELRLEDGGRRLVRRRHRSGCHAGVGWAVAGGCDGAVQGPHNSHSLSTSALGRKRRYGWLFRPRNE
jgi:hypothetical protein